MSDPVPPPAPVGPKKSPVPGNPGAPGAPPSKFKKSPAPGQKSPAPQVPSNNTNPEGGSPKVPMKKMPPPGAGGKTPSQPGTPSPASGTPTGAKSPMAGSPKIFKKAPPPGALKQPPPPGQIPPQEGGEPSSAPTPTGAVSPTPSSGKKSPAPFAGKKSPVPPSGQNTPSGAKSPMPVGGKKMLTPRGPTPTGNQTPPGAQTPTPTGDDPALGASTSRAPDTPASSSTPIPPAGIPPKGPVPQGAWKGPPPGMAKGPPPGMVKGPPPGIAAKGPPPGLAKAPPPGVVGKGLPPGFKGPPGAPQQRAPSPDGSWEGNPPGPPSGDATPGGQSPRGGPPNISNISAIRPDTTVATNAEEIISPAQAARMQFMNMRRKNAAQMKARKNAGPLTVDPRSGLPIINFPEDRKQAFSHMGEAIVLHIFLDCDRISSKGKTLPRVVFVTDRTLFVCEETGGVLRCVQVNKISILNRASEGSNEIALVIPSEYDIILRLRRQEHTDQLINVLKAVYLRMVSKELNVQKVKEIRPSQYRMDKPPGFQLQNIPPRSIAHLQNALEAIELQQEERNETILSMQRGLDQQHQQEVLNKKGEIKRVEEKLKEALDRQKAQKEDLEKLTAAFAKCKKRREEIDSQLGVTGQAPINKDVKIKELQEIVETLTSSVQKASEERQRLEELRRGGDFEERDVDFLEADAPRLRGRSLHYQGLIEVMQRQIQDRENEIVDLTARQVAMQNKQLDLKRKEEQLHELEQLFPNLNQKNFSLLSGPTAAEMLDGPNADTSYLSQPGGGEGGVGAYTRGGYGRPVGSSRHMDPSLNFNMGLNDTRGLAGSDPNEVTIGDKRLEMAATLEDFKEDPRTRLKFAELPPMLREKFPQLQDAVMFFFNEVTKVNKRNTEQRRFVAITDRAVILFGTTGTAIRNIPITKIERLEQDSKSCKVLIRPGGADEYDMLLKLASLPELENFCKIIKKCSDIWERERSSGLSIIQTQIQQSNCRLEKPPAYQPINESVIQKREGLFRAIQETSQRFDRESQRKRSAHINENREAEQLIKQDLQPEMMLRRDREFINLRKILNQLDVMVREKQAEERLILAKIENHRCAIGNLKPSSSFPEEREHQGQYWIPSDPVQIECRMEILQIQFYDDWVITSHPNGFINVWQISTADLYRTLKTNGHTARVQTFHYDGRTLISGGFDSSIRKWSLAEGMCTQFVHHAHEGPVTCLQFDPQRCVTSGGDCKIAIWDTATLKKKRTLSGHRSGVVCFKFEGNTLASADWGWIFIWDLDRGIVLKTLRDDNGGIMSLDLSGVTLLTGGTGGVLTVWNINTTENDQLDGHTDDIHCVQLQGDFAVSSSSDGRILMWQVKELISLGVFHDCAPRECKKFHFKANRFVVGEDTVVKVWTR